MPIYVAEIENSAILAFHHVGDEIAAMERANSEVLRKYILSLIHEETGRSVWDGTSKICTRKAKEDEREAWHCARWKAVDAERGRESDMDFVIVFSPVAEPAPMVGCKT